MYDPDYKVIDLSDAEKIQHENESLKIERNELENLSESFLEEILTKEEELNDFHYTSETYIRHHKNSSRLVRSLTSLIDENNPTWSTEFYNNVLDECVTVLQKDRADKSSSIYFVKDNKLKMFAYNRINFSSSRNRTFKKGEGFAGSVWAENKTLLEDDVYNSQYFNTEFLPKHSYGSIIGTPIRINNEVIGVLCIQSEGYFGFEDSDYITLSYYADICALAYYYDKIKSI